MTIFDKYKIKDLLYSLLNSDQVNYYKYILKMYRLDKSSVRFFIYILSS